MSGFTHKKKNPSSHQYRWRNLTPCWGFLKGRHSHMFTNRESRAGTGVWQADLTLRPVQALMRLNQTSCHQWLAVKRAAQTSHLLQVGQH